MQRHRNPAVPRRRLQRHRRVHRQAETDFNNRVYDEDLLVLEDYAEPRLPLDLRAEISTVADTNVVKYRRLLADVSRLAAVASVATSPA